jgi:hypothetical protein
MASKSLLDFPRGCNRLVEIELEFIFIVFVVVVIFIQFLFLFVKDFEKKRTGPVLFIPIITKLD